MDEIWKIIREPVGDRELEGAQEYQTGSFPLTIETPSQIALQVLNAVFFGLNMNDLQTYRERVNAVRVEDIQRVARNYLRPDRLTIVLVGDAASFVKQLPGAGFDKFEVVPAVGARSCPLPDLRRKGCAGRGWLSAGLLRRAPRTDEAKAWLDKAIAARGGLARLEGIKTVRAEGSMTYATAGKPATFEFTSFIEYPAKFRTDALGPGGKISQVYADGVFWVDDGTGARVMDEAATGPIRAVVERDMVRLLTRAARGKLVVRTVDAGVDEDPLVAAIELSGDGLSPVTLVINRTNGLIEQARYMSELDGRSVETYSDYRNVGGIQVPFHTVSRRGALSPVERDIKTIRFNVPLPATLFVKPG